MPTVPGPFRFLLIASVKLRPRSPNLNAHAERFVRSLKESVHNPVRAQLQPFNRNFRGVDLHTGEGRAFTAESVARIRRRYGLTSRYDRLREAGMLTVEEEPKA